MATVNGVRSLSRALVMAWGLGDLRVLGDFRGLGARRNLITTSRPAERHSVDEKEVEGKKPVTMVPGDGVQPELMQVPIALEIFREHFLREVQNVASEDQVKQEQSSVKNMGKLGPPLSMGCMGSLGPYGALLQQRKLDLFAHVVHVQSLLGYKTQLHHLDLVILGEQTQGGHSTLEPEGVPAVIECLRVITLASSERVSMFAFHYAITGGGEVGAVQKADARRLHDALFLRCCEEMARLHPEVKLEALIVHRPGMQQLQSPHQSGSRLMPSLHGNLKDSLAAGLVWGPGRGPGEGCSAECFALESGPRHPFAQAVRRNIAHLTAMVLFFSNMLKRLSLENHFRMIAEAVKKVVTAGKVRVKNMPGNNSIGNFIKSVISYLKPRSGN